MYKLRLLWMTLILVISDIGYYTIKEKSLIPMWELSFSRKIVELEDVRKKMIYFEYVFYMYSNGYVPIGRL